MLLRNWKKKWQHLILIQIIRLLFIQFVNLWVLQSNPEICAIQMWIIYVAGTVTVESCLLCIEHQSNPTLAQPGPGIHLHLHLSQFCLLPKDKYFVRRTKGRTVNSYYLWQELFKGKVRNKTKQACTPEAAPVSNSAHRPSVWPTDQWRVYVELFAKLKN